MLRQQDERSGCSSAEPYPLACQRRLSAREEPWCQVRFFSSRSSMARYSLPRGRPHPRREAFNGNVGGDRAGQRDGDFHRSTWLDIMFFGLRPNQEGFSH
jgi:hypothetical protein